MLKILLLFISATTLFGSVNIAINKTLLHDIKESYVPVLIGKIIETPIPSVEYDGMKFTNFKIENLTIPSKYVEAYLVDGAIQIEVTNSHLQLSLVTTKNILSFDVSVDIQFGVAIQNLSISLDFTNNRPGNFTIRKVDVKTGQLELGLTGWMKVMIAWLIEGQYDRGTLREAVQDNMHSIICDGLQQILDENYFPPRVQITDDGLYLNITPSQPPLITNDFISLTVNGTFFNDGLPMISSSQPEPLPPAFDTEASSKIQLLITNQSLNSLIYSAWQNNLIQFDITKNDISSDIVGLDTGSLSVAIPK
jgi:hypothetical protein